MFDSLIFIADGKFHPGAADHTDDQLGITMHDCIVTELRTPIPIDNDARDARKLHLCDLTLKDTNITRIVKPDCRRVMRG